jgi:serine/threonine protein kinase
VVTLPRGWKAASNGQNEGGQGWLVEARRDFDDKTYAIKLLKDKDNRRERFEREVRVMARLHKEGVLGIPEIVASGDTSKGRPYYVMPWFPQGSLEGAMALSLEDKLQILLDLAAVLQGVHEREVAHRDLKPANILLSNGKPLLVDFGLCLELPEAGEIGERHTEESRAVGSRLYIAPENESGFNSDNDHRPSDFWAFAKVMWVLIAGRRPLAASDQVEPVNRLGNVNPELVPLDVLAEQLLVRDPNERLSSWDDVRREIADALADLDQSRDAAPRGEGDHSALLRLATAISGSPASAAAARRDADATELRAHTAAVQSAINEGINTQLHIVHEVNEALPQGFNIEAGYSNSNSYPDFLKPDVLPALARVMDIERYQIPQNRVADYVMGPRCVDMATGVDVFSVGLTLWFVRDGDHWYWCEAPYVRTPNVILCGPSLVRNRTLASGGPLRAGLSSCLVAAREAGAAYVERVLCISEPVLAAYRSGKVSDTAEARAPA